MVEGGKPMKRPDPDNRVAKPRMKMPDGSSGVRCRAQRRWNRQSAEQCHGMSFEPGADHRGAWHRDKERVEGQVRDPGCGVHPTCGLTRGRSCRGLSPKNADDDEREDGHSQSFVELSLEIARGQVDARPWFAEAIGECPHDQEGRAPV